MISGDGNCFYRAFAFALGERLLAINESRLFDFFLDQCLTHHVKMLKQAGFEALAIADFHEEYQAMLQKLIEARKRPETALETLVEFMQDYGQSNAVVVHFRFLTSAYLKIHSMLYENFLVFDPTTMSMSQQNDGHLDMETFCRMHVEAMDREADELHIMSLAKAMRVRVNIVHLDAHGDSASFHQFDSIPDDEPGNKPRNPSTDIDIWLLYRPGHYDVLKPKE